MLKQQYCVYNQTSECFLSLGVSLGDNTLARLKGLFGKGSLGFDEGSWITPPKGFATLGVFSSRDLVYLDEGHKVVDVVEGFPTFRVAPARREAASLLALPERTIYSSQTQPGNQLVICVAEEMEFRLRTQPPSIFEDRAPVRQADPESSPKTWLPAGLTNDRRGAFRKRWPRLVAYGDRGEALPVHGVRDISATGLYLMTEERWPLGSEVRMSLQRTDGLDDKAASPITVQLRVNRWGSDGVGLEFVQQDMEQSAMLAMQVR
jgi:uncharacterized membrane protein (UPF0127 family)